MSTRSKLAGFCCSVFFVAATLLANGVAVPGETAESSKKESCPEVPGIEAVLPSARLLLVGELHGTVESPAFVAAVVCRALEIGRPVTVGLEWLETESDRVEAYLQSDGEPSARSALLAGAIWQDRGQAQYGATSEAMLELLDGLRVLVGRGSKVSVYLFNRYGTSSKDRERLMAEALGRQVAISANDLFVILTGNIHSRVALGTPWDPSYSPMGLLLQQAHPDLEIVSLDVAHAGGSAWICVSGEPCGARRQGSRGEAGARFAISLEEKIQSYGHHGRYFVGEIHASPPAVSD